MFSFLCISPKDEFMQKKIRSNFFSLFLCPSLVLQDFCVCRDRVWEGDSKSL